MNPLSHSMTQPCPFCGSLHIVKTGKEWECTDCGAYGTPLATNTHGLRPLVEKTGGARASKPTNPLKQKQKEGK